MNHDAHTLREFDAALSSLNTHLLQMAYKAQSALDLAAAGLLQQNESSANRAIADDEELDELEMTVDRVYGLLTRMRLYKSSSNSAGD